MRTLLIVGLSLTACERTPVNLPRAHEGDFDVRPELRITPSDLTSAMGMGPKIELELIDSGPDGISAAALTELETKLHVSSPEGRLLDINFDRSRTAAGPLRGVVSKDWARLGVELPSIGTGWHTVALPQQILEREFSRIVSPTIATSDEFRGARFRFDSWPVIKGVRLCVDASVEIELSEPVKLREGALAAALSVRDADGAAIHCVEAAELNPKAITTRISARDLTPLWQLQCDRVPSGDWSIDISPAVTSASDVPVRSMDSDEPGASVVVRTQAMPDSGCADWRQP